MRIGFEAVQLFFRHPRCAEEFLLWRQLPFRMQFLEQVPDRILFFFVLVGLKEWPLGREVSDVTVALISHRAKSEDRLVASIARTENVLAWGCGLLSDENF